MPASTSDKLRSTWNSAPPAPTTVTAVRSPGSTTLACLALNWPTDTSIDFATFGKNADGSPNQASVQEFTGIVSGNNVTSITLTSGGADQGNNIGDIAIMKPTAKGHQDLVDAVKTVLNQDGTLKDGIVTTAKINNGAVTTAKIGSAAVTADKLDFTTFTHIRAYAATSVANPASNAVVQYNTKAYDTLSEFNTSTYTFTALNPGKYQIIARYQFGAGGAGPAESAEITVQKNGATALVSDRMTGSGDANRIMRPLAMGTLDLVAGDQIKAIHTGSPGIRDITGSSVFTFIEIHRVG